MEWVKASELFNCLIFSRFWESGVDKRNGNRESQTGFSQFPTPDSRYACQLRDQVLLLHFSPIPKVPAISLPCHNNGGFRANDLAFDDKVAVVIAVEGDDDAVFARF